MNNQKLQIIESIKKLSVEDQLLIVENIWNEIISSSKDVSISEEQKLELDRRLEKSQYSNSGKSWEEVRESVKKSLWNTKS